MAPAPSPAARGTRAGPRGSPAASPMARRSATSSATSSSRSSATPSGGAARGAPLRGEDIHHAITLTLEESYHGGKRQLHHRLPSRDGSGHTESRVLDITIPKGITQGEHLRLRGQGMPGEAPGHDGDLYLEVELASHPHYRLDGRDLTLELPLAPWEAVLGAKVDAPTLGGTVEVTIPAGAQDGQRLRLKGRGLPGKPLGDQYLVLRIAVPKSAGVREQELWRELSGLAHFDPRAGMKGTPA